jgi:glycosyltransferase involved in cell wall biosynthesis
MEGFRVVMVGEFPPRHGGVADYAAELAWGLSRQGVGVSVLTFAEPGLHPHEVNPGGPAVHRAIPPGLGSGLASLRATRALAPDLIHLHLTTFQFNRSFYAFPLLSDSVPMVITAHEVPISYRVVHMLPFVWTALHRASRAIALSRNVREMLLTFHGLDAARVSHIPMAVDLERFNPRHRSEEARRALGWEDRFVVLMAGFHNPGKGVHTLLRAIPAADIPGVKVVIAGEFSRPKGPSLQRNRMENYGEFVRSEISRLGIGHLVELPGYVPAPQLPLLLANADAVVFPYEFSYQSAALQQAMASGAPILASRVDGFREFVEDGRTGLLVPPGAPGSVAEGLRWLHENPGEARSMGAAARRFAEERLDPSIALRKHLEVYGEALGRA